MDKLFQLADSLIKLELLRIFFIFLMNNLDPIK